MKPYARPKLKAAFAIFTPGSHRVTDPAIVLAYWQLTRAWQKELDRAFFSDEKCELAKVGEK